MIVANGLRVSQPRVYFTRFLATENPISEGGAWISGALTGNWQDVRTTPGLAFGVGVCASPPYNDPIALLTGPWTPDQLAYGKVRTVNQQNFNQECAFHLRASMSLGLARGYEILFRMSGSVGWYTDVVRWNGGTDDFDILRHETTGPGVANGDILMAKAVGSVITAYVNGVSVNSYDTSGDSVPVSGAGPARYTGGAPGIGFFQHGQTTATLPDFGFQDFTAIG